METKSRSLRLSLPISVALVLGACSFEAPTVVLPGGSGGSGTSGGTSNETSGSSTVPNAGSTAMAGSTATGGSGSLGGAAAAGSSTMPNAGSGQGGSDPQGGGAGTGTGGGSGGGTSDADVAKALDGLRIDDPCTGNPSTSAGATCNHVMNPFHAKKDVTIAGTPGKTYDVVLRIRGVVEPTKITGGTRPDTSTTTINGKMYRAQPYTVGGTPGDQTYQPWLLTVSAPSQNYFFNDYGLTEHSTFLLDYQVKIPITGGATITLDVNDGNDHEIDNYAKLTNEGVPGSMNLGQYVQINVVSVTAQP